MELKDLNTDNPEKLLDKYTSDGTTYAYESEATEDEKRFIEAYRNSNNATWSVIKVWPEMAKKYGSARMKGSWLMKKFRLKGTSIKSQEVKKQRGRPKSRKSSLFLNSQEGMVDKLKEEYALGRINEEELYERMNNISRFSPSDQARFNATKEMREWLKEAKDEVEASKLSGIEITDLLRDALASLPKEKYCRVLKETRRKRYDIIKERTTIYDADAIRAQEREKIIKSGGVKWQPEAVT